MPTLRNVKLGIDNDRTPKCDDRNPKARIAIVPSRNKFFMSSLTVLELPILGRMYSRLHLIENGLHECNVK